MATPIAALNLHALPEITIARDSDIISIIDDLVERVMRNHCGTHNKKSGSNDPDRFMREAKELVA